MDRNLREPEPVTMPPGHKFGQKLAMAGAPLVMGIVNITPDSFFDGGNYFDRKAAIAHALQLIEDGADILDIGGESTRPGAAPVSAKQELVRVLPVLKTLRDLDNCILSIDTMKPEVAHTCVQNGAHVWNDVSALQFSEKSAKTAAKLSVPVILMHMQGTPKTMQVKPEYKDVVAEVISFLQVRIRTAIKAGVLQQNILVDPGIGFGKRLSDNLQLLASLGRIEEETGCPVLLGASRKRFIAELQAGQKDHNRLGGSLASVAAAYRQGTAIVRVHDVRETRQMLDVMQAISANSTNLGQDTKI